jgi:phytanoyl-CoA hydroxylase
METRVSIVSARILPFPDARDSLRIMVTEAQRDAWHRDGFFVLRGFAPPATGAAMADEAIAEIRSNPPRAEAGQKAYRTPAGLWVQPEGQGMPDAVEPEDRVAKVFNTHLGGTAQEFAVSAACADVVAGLLGDDIDVFQSMFILKNPGAWGQPWHQDSYYFDFDHQPQVGLWLAISEATVENGCLFVLPGSHRRPVETHVPDARPNANQGYLEILGIDESTAVPVLMQPGDLLVFHSYLIHKSVDNLGSNRRAAMVYHYGRAGSVNLAAPEVQRVQDQVTRWLPVRRARAAA